MNPLDRLNFIDPQSILVVNSDGNLKRVFCPFGVISREQIDNIPPLTRMIVEEVGVSVDDVLIYLINGKAYKYHSFHLLIQF